MRALKDVTLTASPGTRYQYSKLNYVTLALIIETVTGKSYGQYLKESIFAPLKMENSFTDVAEARTHGLADGHTLWFGLPFKSLEKPCPDMLGAGYLMVSPEDMAHYLITQLNGGVYDGVRVLSMEDTASMHTLAQLPGEESAYGMGWMNSQEDRETVINHNGQSASFTCSMILLPDRQTGIAVMANVSSLLGPQAAASLAFRIKDMLITGQPLQVDPSYRKFYIHWNIGFLLTTIILFWSFTNPARASVWLSFMLDGLSMLAACLGLPPVLGCARWRGMFVWQPDRVYWCLAVGVLLFFRFTSSALFIHKGKIHV